MILKPYYIKGLLREKPPCSTVHGIQTTYTCSRVKTFVSKSRLWLWILQNCQNRQMWFPSYFGHFKGLRAIISKKKLYGRLLLLETNILSYISSFYHNFENSSFLTFSDTRTGSKISKVCKMDVIIQIGLYKSTYLWG